MKSKITKEEHERRQSTRKSRLPVKYGDFSDLTTTNYDDDYDYDDDIADPNFAPLSNVEESSEEDEDASKIEDKKVVSDVGGDHDSDGDNEDNDENGSTKTHEQLVFVHLSVILRKQNVWLSEFSNFLVTIW